MNHLRVMQQQGRQIRKIVLGWAVALCMLGQTSNASADSEYTQGMSAYIEQDYELAQSFWLQAAKNDNVRAMFNLGLLHQQNKLSNSDPEKARRWFRLAGQGGYAAADYHHAQWLLASGERSEAQALLQRAAKNGYSPAIAQLGDAAPLAASKLDQQSPVKVNGTGQTPMRLDYLAESWLLSKPASAWTIQLLAFAEEAKVRQFIDLHRLHDKAAYFAEGPSNDRLYKLVYGEFDSKEQAEQARGNLKQALREHGPWLRTMASIHSVIR